MNQVIIVDDEENVRKILVRMLSARKLAVESDIFLFASSGKAWDHISQLPEKPAIVISSVDMDGQGKMNGLNLLTAVKEKFPDAIFVSMSGDPGFEEEAKGKGADYFLAKPFTMSDLKGIFA